MCNSLSIFYSVKKSWPASSELDKFIHKREELMCNSECKFYSVNGIRPVSSGLNKFIHKGRANVLLGETFFCII
jgi:hypothetical protein